MNLEQYAGTDAGNLANYHAGMAYLNLGDFKMLSRYLEKFKSDDAILKPIALGAIGDALSETNKVMMLFLTTNKRLKLLKMISLHKILIQSCSIVCDCRKKAEANKLFVEIKENMKLLKKE